MVVTVFRSRLQPDHAAACSEVAVRMRALAEGMPGFADSPKGMRAFEVSKAGMVVGWINGRGYDHCLAQLARLDGYTVSTGVKQAPVTKEVVAAKLATFSDDELAAMRLTRKPQKGKK